MTSSQDSIQKHTRFYGNIPPRPTQVIGRENDLLYLKDRIGLAQSPKSPMTIVRGWPGVGKSTILITLAYEPELTNAYPDGVLWTALGENPNLFSELATWGRALGVEEIGRLPDLQQMTTRLRAVLEERRMLLIIDDVWKTEHALPFKLAGPQSSTIFTTRFSEIGRDLADSPTDVYNLPVLTTEKGLELLKELTPNTVEQEPEESKTLIEDLEGLPLAIQVAGRLLSEEFKMGWGVTELIADLREGARLLTARAPADRVDITNQTTPTVAALLKKSTDTLTEAVRDRFAYLGAFAPKPATFDPPAMAAVWLEDDPKPTIRTLVDRGLLEPVGSRFQMHALLVAHAKSLLEDDEPEEGDSEDPTTVQESIGREALREFLITHFNESELKDLCYELGVDYERLSGSNKWDKVRELITFFERQWGNTIRLEAYIRDKRPGLFQ